MSYNPYESPPSAASPPYGSVDAKAHAKSAVAGPAIALMVVAGICIALLCLTILFKVFWLVSGKAEDMDRGGEHDPVYLAIMHTIWCLLHLGVSAFVLWGANQMRQLRQYDMARITALAAFCCLLGVPFGIWGIVVLDKLEVKAAFES